MRRLTRRLAALERAGPKSDWGQILDALPDAELDRLEAAIERLVSCGGGPITTAGFSALSPDDSDYLDDFLRTHRRATTCA